MENTLKQLLYKGGIHPASFAYFLTEFMKKKGRGKSKTSKLLTDMLKSQAELIRFHLNR